MTVGTSLFIFAVGAVLKFAVTTHTNGFNINEAGVILMIVGAVGFVVSLAYMLLWHDATRRRDVVVDDRAEPLPTRRTATYR